MCSEVEVEDKEAVQEVSKTVPGKKKFTNKSVIQCSVRDNASFTQLLLELNRCNQDRHQLCQELSPPLLFTPSDLDRHGLKIHGSFGNSPSHSQCSTPFLHTS